MKEKIIARFETLIQQGSSIIGRIGNDRDSQRFWLRDEQTTEAQAWISSSANLITMVSPAKSSIILNLDKILNDTHFITGTSVPSHTLQKLQGLLKATYSEFENGMLTAIEFITFAEAFDDFLRHAESFHKSGKKIEAAILASIVLEDTIKIIARKNSIDTNNQTLEPLIDRLASDEIFNSVKSKRIKGLTGIRNKALHAEWEEFDIADVGSLIRNLKEIIEEFIS